MEKRALIAVVISLLILVVYQELVLKRLYPPQGAGEEAGEMPTLSPPAFPEKGEPPKLAAPLPSRPPAEERRVSVETELYKAVFVSTGGRLESFRLKRHRTTVDPNSDLQETVLAGQLGELPFGVELRGSQVLSDAGVPYSFEAAGNLNLSAGQSASLDLVWQVGDTTVRKHFSFSGDRYDFDAQVSVGNVPSEYNELAFSWNKRVDLSPQPATGVIFDHAFYLQDRKLVQQQFSDLSDGKVLTGDIGWSGYAGQYFLAAAVPSGAGDHRLWLKLRDQTVEEKLLFPVTSGAVDVPLDIYIGPKDFDLMEGVGHDLSKAVDLGYFGFIALPLLHALEFSHRFTRNYGADIILLTLLIKVLFIPLTQRSFQSMREMQKLQPQMAKIRERFKDKPEEMNKEIMELYRRHKVNPLGGCLPMLLQIPVFIGLYSALQNAVELRHAPFMLWINDLSAPDRLGAIQLPFVQHPGIPVLTLLMGASMFVQQWMTPAAGDPAQQRVMMIMPLMFTFMFVNFPSGLVLYWLVNNLLTIAQQYYMTRTTTKG